MFQYLRMSKKETALVIDFETANYAANSACAVGVVKVVDGVVVDKRVTLIKPPRSWFAFTHIHGITAEQVEDAPTFADVYAEFLGEWFASADFCVAHNASFDKGVMKATAEFYGIELPEKSWKCTVRISKTQLGFSPANLKAVSGQLGIPLNHHEAMSDALASAHIYIYATTGLKPWLNLGSENVDVTVTTTTESVSVSVKTPKENVDVVSVIDDIARASSPQSRELMKKLLADARKNLG